MTTAQLSAADVLAQLDLAAAGEEGFVLKVGEIRIRVLCPEPLRSRLMTYFADVRSDEAGAVTVHLLPDQHMLPEPAWTDWLREGGKIGRKDAICDLDDARLIRKVRSGVTFFQSFDHAVAFGPLEQNESTVINFINTQVLNIALRKGWHLAHAAAVTNGRQTLAISGLSGGGKSTSILRLMDIDGLSFLSNDRVLIKGGTPARALGIPKQPRINPGTILGNPRLADMLTETRIEELNAMNTADLWALEDKHDLVIRDIYGAGRVRFDAPMTDFWVLNWSHGAEEDTRISEVDLSSRPDLLQAIMKSPGPFYQHVDGRFEPNGNAPDPAPYLDALKGVRVCEVSGKIDFDKIAAAGRDLFDG